MWFYVFDSHSEYKVVSFVLGIIPVETHPEIWNWSEKALFSTELFFGDG